MEQQQQNTKDDISLDEADQGWLYYGTAFPTLMPRDANESSK